MTLLKERLIKHIKRITRPAYLMDIPMNIVDFFIKKLIIYSSYILYYPYWIWRNKSIRNGVIWFAILSALIVEFFSVAVLLSLLGMAGQFALAAFYMVFQFAVMFIFLSSTKTVKLLPGDVGVMTFEKDWFGQEHQVDVVLGTLSMMSRDKQEIMKALGAEPPSGMILTGPPGTGKTLIAQCAASEISIPYIGLNGADLTAMFWGVAEMKVKSIDAMAHKLANQYGGCVVFIDEIDAVASSRGNVEGEENRPQTGGMFGGGGSGVRTQLLTAMSGAKEPQIRTDLINFFFRFFDFEELRDGVVFWLGATNRITTIDSAFLRPGRMDITVQMDPPDKGSRRKIIQGYLDRVKIDDTVDVERLTDDTQTFTPADISGGIERVAARFTIHDDRRAISMSDIENALLEQKFGVANPIAEWDEGQRKQVATHEAGHALLNHLLLPDNRMTVLSIIRRGKGMLGFMRAASASEIYAMPLSDVCARIQMTWAGDIACEVIMGERWTGGRGDFDQIDQFMKTLAGHGYFADQLPSDPSKPFGDKEILEASKHYSRRVKASTRALVIKHRTVIEALRDGLLDKGELNSAETYAILKEHGLYEVHN